MTGMLQAGARQGSGGNSAKSPSYGARRRSRQHDSPVGTVTPADSATRRRVRSFSRATARASRVGAGAAGCRASRRRRGHAPPGCGRLTPCALGEVEDQIDRGGQDRLARHVRGRCSSSGDGVAETVRSTSPARAAMVASASRTPRAASSGRAGRQARGGLQVEGEADVHDLRLDQVGSQINTEGHRSLLFAGAMICGPLKTRPVATKTILSPVRGVDPVAVGVTSAAG